jgi:pimeloyl-ACP methyl ester carboxylesterase
MSSGKDNADYAERKSLFVRSSTGGKMKPQENLLQLKGGFELAYDEYGDRDGVPVFFCHGWPSSRTMAQLTDHSARELGVRIISPDRPGINRSSFQPNRKLTDWPPVVQQLADHLGIERFYVLAVSGGAPYAFVTAWAMPERVRAIAVVSGAPPIVELTDHRGLLRLYRWMLALHRMRPALLRKLFYVARPVATLHMPVRFRPLFLKLFRPSDAAALRDDAAFEACFESARRAWRGSADGLMTDAEVYAQPWGFRLEDVNVPVRFWHGTDDRAFSIGVAEDVAKRLPNCRTFYIEKAGHYSLPIRHVREIIADLISV